MTAAQAANEFISPKAKTGCLLNAVHELGQRPEFMNPATAQVWNAMVFLGLVRGSDADGWQVTPGGDALRQVLNSVE